MFGMKEKLELVANETALVLIDLEHGIVARETKPHDAMDVVERCAKLASVVRAAGGTVVYVHVLLHEIVRMPADKPMMKPGTPPPLPEVSDLLPEAGYQPGTDLLVAKRSWDAFAETTLREILQAKGITTILIGGIATNFGVESTARSAVAHRFAVVFAEDAMSGMSEELHEFAIENLFPIIGRVRTADEISKALELSR